MNKFLARQWLIIYLFSGFLVGIYGVISWLKYSQTFLLAMTFAVSPILFLMIMIKFLKLR